MDEAARMNLLAKAAKRQDGQRLSTPFVLVCPPTEARDTQPKEHSSASQSTSSQACGMSTAPTVSGPIGMFCQDIGVDAKSFFSLKVKGQVSSSLRLEKSRRFGLFQKEWRLYVKTSAFHWKKSVLQTSISFVDALTSKVAKQMVEGNLLPESPRPTCQNVQ